jgi:hypothetical protein
MPAKREPTTVNPFKHLQKRSDHERMSDALCAPSMQLLAQDYAEVLGALKALTDSKGHERRTAARIDAQAQVKIYPCKDGAPGRPFTCLTCDLSFNGVGLFQSRQSNRGSQFVIELPRREDRPLILLCMVMYCRALADGLYNVGATFIEPYDFNAPPAGGFGGNVLVTGGETELNRIRNCILA